MSTRREFIELNEDGEPGTVECTGSYACDCAECAAERDRLVARGVRPKPKMPTRISTLQPWDRGPWAA